jgi:hypothetical protein
MISSCSPDRKLLKEHDYAAVIRNSIEELNRDAKDPKASNTLIQTYSQAIGYYQNEIDLMLTSNDPFRWTKTLDVMQQTNELSEEILYNSSASRLICEPKIYRDEMADITSKAAAELYQQGVNSLKQSSKEKAREAYFYFVRASQLNPKYKDVCQKIQEAKSQATLKIIIETVPVTSQNNLIGYSTETFYYALFYSLHQKFPSSGFIAFYSPEEAEKQNINNPDYSIQIEIEDFEIESRNFKKEGKIPYKDNTGENYHFYQVSGQPPNIRVPGHPPNDHGSYSPDNIRTQLLMIANSVLMINALSDNKVVLKKKIPWHCTEELNQPVSSKIGQSYLLGNSDDQLYFDHFSLSMVDKVVLIIADFLNNPINISAMP